VYKLYAAQRAEKEERLREEWSKQQAEQQRMQREADILNYKIVEVNK